MQMYTDHHGLEDIGRTERKLDFVRPISFFHFRLWEEVAESISILSENIEKRLKTRYIIDVYGEK